MESTTGLHQIIKTATRLSPATSTLIDMCFTNIKHISAAGTININVIDHLASLTVKKKDREDKRSKQFRGRDYSKLCIENVENKLVESANNMVDTDPNIFWLKMEKSFTTVATALCPKRDFVIKRERPDYFTSDIGNLIQTRDRLFKKARVATCKNKKRQLGQKATKKRKEVRLHIKQAHVMGT